MNFTNLNPSSTFKCTPWQRAPFGTLHNLSYLETFLVSDLTSFKKHDFEWSVIIMALRCSKWYFIGRKVGGIYFQFFLSKGSKREDRARPLEGQNKCARGKRRQIQLVIRKNKSLRGWSSMEKRVQRSVKFSFLEISDSSLEKPIHPILIFVGSSLNRAWSSRDLFQLVLFCEQKQGSLQTESILFLWFCFPSFFLKAFCMEIRKCRMYRQGFTACYCSLPLHTLTPQVLIHEGQFKLADLLTLLHCSTYCFCTQVSCSPAVSSPVLWGQCSLDQQTGQLCDSSAGSQGAHLSLRWDCSRITSPWSSKIHGLSKSLCALQGSFTAS